MSRLAFNIFVIPLLYFISILPFWLLYFLSSCLYLLVYYIIGYRKKVVLQNLRKSFPEKTEVEIQKICKQFYKHFCDVIFEILKLLTISPSEYKKRFEVTQNGINVFTYFENKKQSIIGVMGHCGNWEWGAIAPQFYFQQLITGVYHPLSNKNFDLFMLNLRGRMGGNIVSMKNLYRELLTLKSKNIPTTVGLIADQTPPPESAYWTTFLNQDTPVFVGPEKLAKKFNYPVVYVGLKKLKRGYYQMDATILTEKPNELPDGVISELHTKALEKNITEQPYIWLWSHRRWKHTRPVNLFL
ncbi:MAG: lysophospholipid acyltransferase family protein [Bacteroidetes bacterium]|nr:lysophospholipid acyltransferase family protein [Bacteroidota bacterium]